MDKSSAQEFLDVLKSTLADNISFREILKLMLLITDEEIKIDLALLLTKQTHRHMQRTPIYLICRFFLEMTINEQLCRELLSLIDLYERKS